MSDDLVAMRAASRSPGEGAAAQTGLMTVKAAGTVPDMNRTPHCKGRPAVGRPSRATGWTVYLLTKFKAAWAKPNSGGSSRMTAQFLKLPSAWTMHLSSTRPFTPLAIALGGTALWISTSFGRVRHKGSAMGCDSACAGAAASLGSLMRTANLTWTPSTDRPSWPLGAIAIVAASLSPASPKPMASGSSEIALQPVMRPSRSAMQSRRTRPVATPAAFALAGKSSPSLPGSPVSTQSG